MRVHITISNMTYFCITWVVSAVTWKPTASIFLLISTLSNVWYSMSKFCTEKMMVKIPSMTKKMNFAGVVGQIQTVKDKQATTLNIFS